MWKLKKRENPIEADKTPEMVLEEVIGAVHKVKIPAHCEWCKAKQDDRPAVFCSNQCEDSYLAIHPQK